MSDGLTGQSGFDGINDEAFIEGLRHGGAEYFFDLALGPWYRFWERQPAPHGDVDDSVALSHFVRDGFHELERRLARLHPTAIRDAANAFFRMGWATISLRLDMNALRCEPRVLKSDIGASRDVGSVTTRFLVSLSSSHSVEAGFSAQAWCRANVRAADGAVGAPGPDLSALKDLAAQSSAIILPERLRDANLAGMSFEDRELFVDALIESSQTPGVGPILVRLDDCPALGQAHWVDSVDHLANNLRLDGFSLYTGNPEHVALGGPCPPPPAPGSRQSRGEPNWACLELLTRQLRLLEALESKLSEDFHPEHFSEAWIDAFYGFDPPAVNVEFSDIATPDWESVEDFTIMNHCQSGGSRRITHLALREEDEILQHEVLNGWTADGTIRTENPSYQLMLRFWHDRLGTVTITASVKSEPQASLVENGPREGLFSPTGSQSVTVALPLTSNAWATLILQSLAHSQVTRPAFRLWGSALDVDLGATDGLIGRSALGWETTEASE